MKTSVVSSCMIAAENVRWHQFRVTAPFMFAKAQQLGLLDKGSMTLRLRKASTVSMQVQVVDEGWRTAMCSERARLGLNARMKTWVRTTRLQVDSKTWIYARSVFPQTTFLAAGQKFRCLGERPLGDVLFRDATLRRSDFDLAELKPKHQEYRLAMQDEVACPDNLLARRSVFHYYGRPLLVTEILLPASFT